MSQTLRLVAAITSVLVAALAAASCRDVVAGEGIDAAADLCEILDRCYDSGTSSCTDKLEARFGVDGDDDDLFVQRYGALACGETCSAALGCLSLAPVCTPQGGACARKEECCGGAFGEMGCGTSETCCLAQRQPCKDDPDACCGGAAECKLDRVTRRLTCGGKPPCATLDAPCTRDDDCCSASCDPDSLTCRREPCAELGAPCAGAECCSPDASCTDGVCVLAGTACLGSACTPTSAVAATGPGCCPDHPLCFPLSNGVDGRCGAASCRPEGASCDEDAACCGQGVDQTAYCDRSLGEGTCALFPGVCALAGSLCVDDGACCSAHCAGGACQPSPRVTCSPPDCGNLCVAGPPKSPDACAVQGRAACIADVCAASEGCCCTEWDAVCIAIASDLPSCVSC